DALTLMVSTRYVAIRHNVYSTRPSPIQLSEPALEMNKKYEVIVDLSKNNISLRLKELGSSSEFLQILDYSLTDEVIRQFNIPLCGHLAFFTYDMNDNNLTPVKTIVSQLNVKTEEI
ncbi:MAG: hypothetical protein KJ043_17225, partial [Anaerolineae bacterium]|nr:hypothetical protein [Anaerolineae bacterium]